MKLDIFRSFQSRILELATQQAEIEMLNCIEVEIDAILSERRMQINKIQNEETQAHLHTFVNHFETNLKERLSSKLKGEINGFI